MLRNGHKSGTENESENGTILHVNTVKCGIEEKVQVSKNYYIDASESVYSFLRGRKGGHHLVYDNYIYRSNFRRHGLEKNVFYFECIWNRNGRCRGRIKTVGDKIYRSNSNVPHNHEPDYVRIQEARQKGLISLKSLSEAAREYEERVQIKVEMIPEMLNECLTSPFNKSFTN